MGGVYVYVVVNQLIIAQKLNIIDAIGHIIYTKRNCNKNTFCRNPGINAILQLFRWVSEAQMPIYQMVEKGKYAQLMRNSAQEMGKNMMALNW